MLVAVVVIVTAPLLRSALLWCNAIVATARDVWSVAVEMNATQQMAALRRTTPFPIVSSFAVIVMFQITTLMPITQKTTLYVQSTVVKIIIVQ